MALAGADTPGYWGFDTANLFGSNGAGSLIIARNDNYRAAATVTHLTGKHTLKFGAEFLRLTHNYAQTNVPSGTFTFNPDLTAANAISTAGSGSGLATFLLGYPSSGKKDGRWHSIRVELRNRNYKVRARRGYVAS